jgi:hypothetical protein
MLRVQTVLAQRTSTRCTQCTPRTQRHTSLDPRTQLCSVLCHRAISCHPPATINDRCTRARTHLLGEHGVRRDLVAMLCRCERTCDACERSNDIRNRPTNAPIHVPGAFGSPTTILLHRHACDHQQQQIAHARTMPTRRNVSQTRRRCRAARRCASRTGRFRPVVDVNNKRTPTHACVKRTWFRNDDDFVPSRHACRSQSSKMMFAFCSRMLSRIDDVPQLRHHTPTRVPCRPTRATPS